MREAVFLMDPLETINVKGDSTYVLALEAQKRGYRLWHTLPEQLHWVTDRKRGQVMGHCREFKLHHSKDSFYSWGAEKLWNLENVDVIWMRQDPPFDMSYITCTHLLELLAGKTLVVNDPIAVRNAPEKLLITHFFDLIPPTLITRDRGDIRQFREEYQDIIVKPLFGNGGYGVFRIKPDDENLESLIEMFQSQSREPVMVQQYLSDVRQGDKRIILIDGKPAGAIDRIPQAGEVRSNMHVGGKAVQAKLSERDQGICQRIGGYLRDNNLIFVGIDVIGGHLTEINVTSPTGLQEINRYDNCQLEAEIWDAIESRIGSD